MSETRIETLLAKLEKGLEKSLEILQSLGEDQWEAVILDGPEPWTVTDLVSHFVYSEENLLQSAQDIVAGGQGFSKDFDIDAFNRTMLVERRHLEFPLLLSQLAAAREKTLRWLAGLEERLLDLGGWHPMIGKITVEGMIELIYGHQLIHMREAKPKLSIE